MTKILFDAEVERQYGKVEYETDFKPPYTDGLAGHHAAAGDTEMAAARAATTTLSAKCLDVLYHISIAGDRGYTDEEGQTWIFSWPKRRCDLYHAGLVRDSGRRRPSSRGKQMIVWVVAC
jgi:hypothetical protein